MKKLTLICIIWLQNSLAVSEPLDSVSSQEYRRHSVMYNNIEARLKKAEQNKKVSIHAQQDGMKRIGVSLERMRNKFVKYFQRIPVLCFVFFGVSV